MTIFLVIVASIVAVLSWAGVSSATSGVAGICFGCFLGIMARIYQAGEQHREIIRHLSKPPIVVMTLAALCASCNAIAVPPTSPSVVPPVVVIDSPPDLPPPAAVELALDLGRDAVYAGEGVSLYARPVKGTLLAPAVYEWTFGDGTTATTELGNTGHVYAQGGEFPASVHVRDRDGREAEASTVVVVTSRPRPPSDRPPPPPPPCPTITLTPSTLPSGTVDSNYSRRISAAGGKSPYGFSVSSGTLPAGLLLSDAGVLSGTPTTAGTSTFVVNAFDSNSCLGQRSYTVTIANKPGVMTATMSCTPHATLNRVSCNISSTYNGSPVPSGDVTRVDWDWGDGSETASTAPLQDHLYGQPGTWTIVGVVQAMTNDGPKTATASKTVTVPAP